MSAVGNGVLTAELDRLAPLPPIASRSNSPGDNIPGRPQGTKAEPFAYWRLADMRNLWPPRYVVEGVIPAKGSSVLFAPSGHYKTMTALDLVVAVAYGRSFHGLAVEACPIVYVANEDAHGVARQRLLGLLDYHGLDQERIVVVPGDVSLSSDRVIDRLVATMEAAFPGEGCGFVFDTWDKSLGGDPDKTAEVVPAVQGLEELIERGAVFNLTLSHSPWSSPERTKGSVAYWASMSARIRVERDEASGRGKLDVVHQKNGPSGLQLEFEYERHAFEVEGETCTTLVPKRLMDAPERTAGKEQTKPRKPRGKNQRIALDALHAAICDGADPTPPARDIPAKVKGGGADKWRAAFERLAPGIAAKHLGTRFGEAVETLVADRWVRHVDGFYWPPAR